MIKFKKPRYKSYKILLEDVRNDYRLEKFNTQKWLSLKKLFRFQLNKWRSVYFKRFYKKPIPYFIKRKKERFIFLKKLHFVMDHYTSYFGVKNKVKDLSIYNHWGQRSLRKDYKNNLIKKRRLCCYYNIQDYKLKKLVHQSQRRSLLSSSLNFDFIKLLESRLENILYKSGFVKSISQSRQLINYGNVLVNKVCQTKGSYCVNPGDLIEFTQDFSKISLIVSLKEQRKLWKPKKKKRRKKKFIRAEKLKNRGSGDIKVSRLLGFFNSYFFFKKEMATFYYYYHKDPKKACYPFYRFFFYRFFPSYLEVNYKTLSILYMGSGTVQKSFKYYLDLPSLLSFYKYH